MTQPIPIHEGRDFYVPAFQVTLRGRPLDQAVVRDVIRVEYSDDVEAIRTIPFNILTFMLENNLSLEVENSYNCICVSV
jgi:hypothetical protein